MPSTRTGKAKGRTGQQEVRDLILKTFPELEKDDVRSTAMGQGGVDVQLSPAAQKKLPLSIEVKRRKAFKTLYNYLSQADRGDDKNPVVFLRGDRQPWLVIIKAEYLMELLNEDNS